MRVFHSGKQINAKFMGVLRTVPQRAQSSLPLNSSTGDFTACTTSETRKSHLKAKLLTEPTSRDPAHLISNGMGYTEVPSHPELFLILVGRGGNLLVLWGPLKKKDSTERVALTCKHFHM